MRFVIAALLILVLFSCQNQPASSVFTPRFTASNEPPVKVDGKKTPYTFGYLEVLENRQRPNGPTIQLPVYIFKSRKANPAPDPVLYTVGGPGYTSMGAAPYMRAFQYLDDRDLILFEQRGTTHAKPNLACPEWTEVAPRVAGLNLSPEALNAEYVKAAEKCRDRLKAQNIDLDAYNTREIAADIEDLRRALNIDQLNLLTISYSTKIAQTMMRDFPASLRSVVIDSPLPLAVNYDESSITNLMETYDRVFSDCANSPNCAAKYPNLAQRFRDFLTKVSDQPLALQVGRADGKGDTTVQLRSADVVDYLPELYTSSAASFPAMLDAIINGNTQILKDNFSWPTAGSGNGKGMRLSVWCSEELSFTSPEKVAEESTRFPFLRNRSPLVFSFEVCQTWSVRAAPAEENEPINSDIPTLLISGTYDVVTPVKWATQLNRELSNSHHLIFPGWSHGPTTYWDNSCAMEAANAFFNSPGRAPELTCFQDLTLPVFN
ncbi:alpha/beta fold hydrolase [Neolewinella persica]|uniref:alpha/beta fold hydrolase n=1 Tax=Neolewinella persica TaxID=70998 RepID=UPI0003742396|nr:alpha/beta fold hydrolase [Neolewinella persica]